MLPDGGLSQLRQSLAVLISTTYCDMGQMLSNNTLVHFELSDAHDQLVRCGSESVHASSVRLLDFLAQPQH